MNFNLHFLFTAILVFLTLFPPISPTSSNMYKVCIYCLFRPMKNVFFFLSFFTGYRSLFSFSPPHPPLLLFDLVLCNLIVVQFNLISLALFMIFSSVHHLDEHGIQLNFKSITGSGLCIPIADLILNFCCTGNKMRYVV